ncbi:polysaccharide deacetylase family protein [Streptomonospora sp. S1-112]|uniref:Polysaccharide deacetylase family protein n=1 Tax=Streptomonospora mangrovi TaxID=2883123 RepID=A0A9X3NM07_9ACTN|nr:polysaccharide deacetylase family protein [Streptomonospora mangrovi]MDA0566224.1 polysaccharide deacetylase family protein [Streptomonospora mangrovi]
MPSLPHGSPAPVPRPGRPRRTARTVRASRTAAVLAAGALLAAASGCGSLKPPDPAPTAATRVAQENVPGIGARPAGADAAGRGFTVRASVPDIPNAAPLADHLAGVVAQEAADFRAAVDSATRLEVDWELTAAGRGLVGVRLVRTEHDHRGVHDSYATYWYDTATGATAYSTELLAGDAELRRLDRLVAAALEKGGGDPAALHPGFRLYDSLAFNHDGDLVVEFDAGRVAPLERGRVAAVVAAEDARPLLSDLGRRARAASALTPHAFSIAEPPAGDPRERRERPVPGSRPPAEDHDCGGAVTCVALTFDDGPDKRTPEVLDLLAAYDAKATFFVPGHSVRNEPALVGRAFAEGHQLGNHGDTHETFAGGGRDRIDAELSAVDALIRRETGTTVDIMRPPFGRTDPAVAEVAREHGQAQVIWDTDTEDWTGLSAEEVLANTVARTPPNGVVLLHDTEDATVDALPRILEHFTAQGYALVTIADLLEETEPGAVYYSADPALNAVCIRLAGCP